VKKTDLQLEKVFQDKIEEEIKIESKDWVPDVYRRTNIRQISQQKKLSQKPHIAGKTVRR
jgi:hypothetical protein